MGALLSWAVLKSISMALTVRLGGGGGLSPDKVGAGALRLAGPKLPRDTHMQDSSVSLFFPFFPCPEQGTNDDLGT